MAYISPIFNLLGSLAIFLFGMKVMSEALQKVAGSKLKSLLARATSNRLSAVVTGLLVTTVVQSSSATTVMVVSFVNAQLLTLVQAIGVIMGANIGTTVTGWLVALLGFKVKLTAFALPAIGIGFGLTFINGARVRQWGEALLGFGLLFLGLGLLKSAVPEVEGDQLQWMESMAGEGFFSMLLFVGIGAGLTVVLQSSSATMTLTLTLTAMGWIPYPAAIAMILGENIGTTATANLAAIGTSVVARRAARAHLVFNLIGVVWALALMHVFLLPLVDVMVPGDPETALARLDPLAAGAVLTAHLAAFHTIFNIINTAAMLPFVGHIARFVTRWIPGDDGVRTSAKFISTALVQTPELLLVQVGKEMQRMTTLVCSMHEDAMHILAHPDEKLGSMVEDTLCREQLTDDLEIEITGVLAMTARAATSAEASRRIGEMALNTHRLERIGDHCEKLVEIAIRHHDSTDERIDPRAVAELRELGLIVRRSLDHLGRYLAGGGSLAEASAIEDEINEARDRLRAQHVERMREGSAKILPGLWFLDALQHLEEIGDRSYGIVRRSETTKQM